MPTTTTWFSPLPLNFFVQETLAEALKLLRTELLCATGKSQFFKVQELQEFSLQNSKSKANQLLRGCGPFIPPLKREAFWPDFL